MDAGAFGGGREGVALAEYQTTSDRNRAASTSTIIYNKDLVTSKSISFTSVQAQQRGLASLQPSLVAANVQQLGSAGTSGLAFNQALLDAAQQRAQLAYQEPISRLNVLGTGFSISSWRYTYFNTNCSTRRRRFSWPIITGSSNRFTSLWPRDNIWR